VHSVLGWKTWLTAALALCAGLIVLQVFQGVQPLQAAQRGVSWSALAVTLFVTTPIWRLLWLIPFFQKRAPMLDGAWTGVVSSNWSIVEAIKDAAKQQGAPALDVDAAGAALPCLTQVEVIATIRTGFFTITMALESLAGRYQTSSLKVVELKPGTDGANPSLNYIFEGRVLQPRPGDVSCFDGAGVLSVRAEPKVGLAMEGPTWTNRAWSRGLNTAGVFRVTRDARTFWPAVTFGLLKF
jgi:hypothetical protein